MLGIRILRLSRQAPIKPVLDSLVVEIAQIELVAGLLSCKEGIRLEGMPVFMRIWSDSNTTARRTICAGDEGQSVD